MVAIEINSIVRVRRSEVDLNKGGCQMYVLETAVVGLGNSRYDGGFVELRNPASGIRMTFGLTCHHCIVSQRNNYRRKLCKPFISPK